MCLITYLAETYILTEKNKETQAVFERQILRSSFGGIKLKTNIEFYRVYKNPDRVSI